MTTVSVSPSSEHAVASASRVRRRLVPERFLPLLILLPSLVSLAIFVYGFIGMSFWFSISNWRTLKPDLSIRQPLFATYGEMFAMTRFQSDLRNTLIFTILFLLLSIGGGLLLAIALDRRVFGRALFRNVFLFPYSLSFIVTGIAWRWIFNPETGINLLFDIFGINKLLAGFGIGPLKPGWLTDPTVILTVNDTLAKIIPAAGALQVKLGIPVAIIPVVLAAAWQLPAFRWRCTWRAWGRSR